MPKENEYVHLVIKNDGTVECVKSIFHINEPTTLIEMEQTTAIEVPVSHGRLIDADMAYQETMRFGNHFREIVLKTIDVLPTVIESEIKE